MKTPEKSVEEIVEEFEKEFSSELGHECGYATTVQPRDIEEYKDWLRQTLQTERQKREEAVVAERERVWLSAYRAGQADARADVDTKDITITQPNNPK